MPSHRVAGIDVGARVEENLHALDVPVPSRVVKWRESSGGPNVDVCRPVTACSYQEQETLDMAFASSFLQGTVTYLSHTGRSGDASKRQKVR